LPHIVFLSLPAGVDSRRTLGKKKEKGSKVVAEVPYYIQMGKNSQNNHTYCPMAETVVGNHNNK
jgi:hypothetical protein